MLNHAKKPKEMLEWLSQRNHHIPFDDLAYLLGTNSTSEDAPMTCNFDEDVDFLSEFNFD